MQGGTDWEARAYSCKEEQLQWEGRRIFSLPLKHIGSIQQSSQGGLAHHIFLSQCLWEPEDAVSQEARQQQSAAGNSWLSQASLSDLPAAGSAECHSKAAPSLAPVPSLLTLLCFTLSVLSQNKVYVGRAAMNWAKYFITSSMCFVRRDRRLYLCSA